ncbi:MAG: hypothetical protein GF334_08015 [Candidatus Altiarchaeales archaeon]|nr:hypothetical protein [Candidatus Altiarchaeales archaeon]
MRLLSLLHKTREVSVRLSIDCKFWSRKPKWAMVYLRDTHIGNIDAGPVLDTMTGIIDEAREQEKREKEQKRQEALRHFQGFRGASS